MEIWENNIGSVGVWKKGYCRSGGLRATLFKAITTMVDTLSEGEFREVGRDEEWYNGANSGARGGTWLAHEPSGQC